MTTQLPHLGVIVGSTREGRFGDRPANWIHDLALRRTDLSVEFIDLRDYPLPMFNEPLPPARKPATDPVAVRWADRLAGLDGLILVTPEYNHGYPGVVKNALDHAFAEYARKSIGFVGYGGVGAARAIEQLRLVSISLQMAPVRNAVHIGLAEYLGVLQQGKALGDFPNLVEAATGLLDEMVWWARSLRAARNVDAAIA